ncbi:MULTISPECIES: TetR/AcrR family transcriptional regulator [unclassified Streptomyces]|uniref:TetR/AcrR family transcriptional regulator n=1 Tax=unclassified Streptomyces TaxID=2593676 RepID=UPI00081E3E20|nr:TetR/AcrR family transcriptional regulator [Streptomyces sp. ScaeMP-e83]MYR95015.1 TetR family transcriptional regulator [Streptomyces sp. SID4937]SCD81870.1 transcriptional regulator, TetR family [Streptomyces sp. ScaeMP-e83]
MGHREDLLEGAKRCLLEKGFARTSARDIVAASGTNLASIGYHYGSKDALLTEAYVQAIQDWGDEFGPGTAISADLESMPATIERFEMVWNRIIELFPARKPLWALNVEVAVHAAVLPEVREGLARVQPQGWSALVALFHGVDESEIDEETAATVGSFYAALLNGVMTLWLFSPETAPSGRDLADAMRATLHLHGGDAVGLRGSDAAVK